MSDERDFQNPLELWRQFLTDSERQWNAFFKDVLGTDLASNTMNAWVEASITVQRMVADQLERYYQAFNLPTHGDLVALGERIKSVEDTLARIESVLEAQAFARSGGTGVAVARPKPSRTKRPPVATPNGPRPS